MRKLETPLDFPLITGSVTVSYDAVCKNRGTQQGDQQVGKKGWFGQKVYFRFIPSTSLFATSLLRRTLFSAELLNLREK